MREGTQPAALPRAAPVGGCACCGVSPWVAQLSRPASQAQDPELSKGELFRGSEERRMQSPSWDRPADVGLALPRAHYNLKALWLLTSSFAAAVCRLEISQEVTKARLRVATAREFGVSRAPPAFLSFRLEMCSKASPVLAHSTSAEERRLGS